MPAVAFSATTTIAAELTAAVFSFVPKPCLRSSVATSRAVSSPKTVMFPLGIAAVVLPDSKAGVEVSALVTVVDLDSQPVDHVATSKNVNHASDLKGDITLSLTWSCR
jgi:hypothetical protein